jgi:hypothetical protein
MAQDYVELNIQPPGSTESIEIKGAVGNIHQDPKKIHQLLDLLGLPKGTEVKVTTKASSVIVR